MSQVEHEAHEAVLQALVTNDLSPMGKPRRVEMRRRVEGNAVVVESREQVDDKVVEVTMREGEVQDAIGQPGTVVRGGKIYAEPEQAYSTYIVRGSSGNAGLYEENYRGEPLIMDAISSHTEVIVQGRVRLDVPEGVPDEQREQVEQFVERQAAAFASMPGGWVRYLDGAVQTVLKHGHAPHEVVWGHDAEGRPYVHELAFYEPSVVDRWYFSEDARRLMGASFRTSGEGPTTWFTPATGDRVTAVRLIVPALNAVGNNVEGVSPQRPALFYVRAKRLLLQLAAIAAEKFGVPVTKVMEMAPAPGTQGASKSVIQRIFKTFKFATGRKPVVVSLPHNVAVELTSPSGAMPSFDSLIQYCDTMIAMTFSVEGSLLGLQSSAGSFALGEVRERDALRSAPRYARAVLAPINALVRAMALEEMPDLVDVPQLVWSPQEPPKDNAARFAMLAQAFGRPLDDWPELAQGEALKILDLPPNTFSKSREDDADGVEGDAEEDAGESQFDALVENAEASCGCSGGCASGCSNDRSSIGFSDLPSMIGLSELPPDLAALEGVMDRAERRLANTLAGVQREMRQAWRDEVRVAADPIGAGDNVRARFRVRAIDAMREHVDNLAREVGARTSGELGMQGEYEPDALDLRMIVAARADEFVNRAHGVMNEAEVDRRSGGVQQTVPVLAASTLAAIAATITGRVVNRARTDVFEEFAEQSGTRVMATRTAVLDRSTCVPCRNLDGERAAVGSARYRALMPPHSCEGGARCRCVMRLDIEPA